MLQAVTFYSHNLVVSEQFDATTGYEKSVSNLSRSYTSVLSAAHAMTPPEGPSARRTDAGGHNSAIDSRRAGGHRHSARRCGSDPPS